MALNPKSEPGDLTLVHLRGLRKEMAAMFENHARDRQLIIRMMERLESVSTRMDEGFASIRRDIAGLSNDVLLLENNLLTRHNEILDLARKIDEPEEQA